MTLAAQSVSGVHYGFILFSGAEDSGDCIFQVLPKTSRAFEKADYQFLEQFGFRIAGEHRWAGAGDEIQLWLSDERMAVIDLNAGELKFAPGEAFRVVSCGSKDAEEACSPE